jgi:hypothetical protein
VNAELSVIVVSFNDAPGLERTLRSLSRLAHKPRDVLVVDGGSPPATLAEVPRWAEGLALKLTSEPDGGIYDAMNKGLARAQGRLLHYLNGGDTVVGEPYAELATPCRLPVTMWEPDTGRRWLDQVKLAGLGYCHQGVILPAGHRPYDLRFRLCADLDLLAELYPQGLQQLPMAAGGGVVYTLGGQSSQRLAEVHRELRTIARQRLPWRRRAVVEALLAAKSLVPRGLRRAVRAALG